MIMSSTTGCAELLSDNVHALKLMEDGTIAVFHATLEGCTPAQYETPIAVFDANDPQSVLDAIEMGVSPDLIGLVLSTQQELS